MLTFRADQKTFTEKSIQQDNLLRIKTLKILICLFLILVTFAAFWKVRNNEFINLDDDLYVTDNPHVQKGLTLRGILWAFTTMHAGHWHPMTWLSHLFVYDLFGLNPSGHHMVNLLFHVVNTLLLFLLFQRMTASPWRSGFMAALFALHPLHVESVAWIAERKDVLCAFFWMLTMWAYVSYVQKPKLHRYLLVVLCFILALMSKPMAVTLPFVLLLLDYWPLSRLQFDKSKNDNHRRTSILRLISEKVPLFFITAVLSWLTILAQWKGGAISTIGKLPLGIRIGNALVSYVMYISKMLWPKGLAVLYPHPIMLPLWEVAGAALLLGMITVLVIRVGRKRSYSIVGWLWYLGTLVPVIGFVQVGIQAMADRFTYLPLIGLFMMIAYGVPDILAEWRYRRAVLIASGSLVLLILMITTISQVKLWQNSVTLFNHTLKVTNNNSIIHNNLGVTLARQGKDQEAIVHYKKALEIEPNYADAHYNLGALLARQGKEQEAVTQFIETLRTKPDYAQAHNDLGLILTKQGKIQEALTHFTEAVRTNPNYAEAHFNLGIALLRQGKILEAIVYFNQTLQINPKDARVHQNLGVVLASQGKTEEAIAHLIQALQINPNNADAHYSLASLLLRQGKDQEAMVHYIEALRINPDDAEAHYKLAEILARRGENDEAIVHLTEAIRISPNYGEAHLALGRIYLSMGKEELALAEYHILKKINSNLANTLYQNISKPSH
jgi:tetratricopeptide (TPR) repeat protein